MDYGLPHPTARPDEERIVGRAFHILATGDFRPGTQTYPGLMIYINTLALALYTWLGQLFGIYRERFDFLFAAVVTDPGLQYRICRTVSVLLGVATVWSTYLLTRVGYQSRHAGLLAGALMATSYVHVRDSRFATVDIGMTFFVTMSLLFTVKTLQSYRTRNFILAGVFAGLATSAKYNAAAVALSLAVVCLPALRDKNSGPSRRFIISRLAIAAFAMVSVFAISSPYTFVNFRATVFEINEAQRVLYEGESERALPIHLRVSFPVGYGWPFFLAAILGLLRAAWKHRWTDLALLAYFIPVFGTAAGVLWVFPRYIIPVTPVLAAFAAELIKNLINYIRIDRRLSLAVAMALFAGPVGWTSTKFDLVASRKDTRVLAEEWIRTHLPPRSSIAYCGGYGAPSINTDRRRPPVFQPVEVTCDPSAAEARTAYLVTHEHPVLLNFSPDISKLRAVLNGKAFQIKVFNPFVPPFDQKRLRQKAYFFEGDGFYLPFSGLDFMERGGPIIRVWKFHK